MDFLSAINAGSSLLSTVGGLFGGKGPNRKDAERAAWESAKIQKYLWEWQLPSLTSGAKAAGLHPLVAAGVNPASGPTVGVVGDTGPSAMERMGELGQGIGRAAGALQTRNDRAFTETTQGLILEKMKLENDLLRGQITTIHRPTNPPYPDPSLNTGDTPSTAGGIPPASQIFMNRDGSSTIWPSQEAKQAIEDNLIYEMEHAVRNRLMPWLDRKTAPFWDKLIDNRANWKRAHDATGY